MVRNDTRVGSWWRPIVAGVLMSLVAGSAHAASRSQVGVNQRVLVICVKYDNVATTRLTSSTDWVTLLNNEVNQFYNRATYNQTNFRFETPAGMPNNGWLDLGYANTAYEFYKTSQDAINLIDASANFANYDRVVVITNWTGFGGQGGGPWWWQTAEGTEANFLEGGVTVGKRLMTMCVTNEWEANGYGLPFDEAASVVAHELGHELGLPTHYGSVSWHPGHTDRITPWGIMGLSPGYNHFIGWAKQHRSWIPAMPTPRIEVIGPPAGSDINRTIRLEPLETSTAGAQLIRIPFTTVSGGDPFSGYVLETRRQINGDEQLPKEGVLISLVDESPDTVLKLVVVHNPNHPGDMEQAPLVIGESFSDPTRNLTIDVLSETGNAYNVRVRYNLPAAAKPDPQMIPWGAPPYETVDIWVDSQKNGWGTYRYTDGGGNPTGNGDDAWVDHDNRVYARVRNIGPGAAANVRVQVYQNDPPGMGDSGADWKYLGTILFPAIPAGGTVENWVKWKPKVGSHTCIKAIIDDIAGELSHANNRAQENVTHFDSSSASPFRPVGLKLSVNNPFEDEDTSVHMHVRDVPLGWTVMVEPRELRLRAGGTDSIQFMVFPSGSPGARITPEMESAMRLYQPGFLGKPIVEAQVPYADTWITIGGVEVWTRLTQKTTLTMEVITEEGATPGITPGGTTVPGGGGGTVVPGGQGGTVAPGGTIKLPTRGTLSPRRLPTGPVLLPRTDVKPNTEVKPNTPTTAAGDVKVLQKPRLVPRLRVPGNVRLKVDPRIIGAGRRGAAVNARRGETAQIRGQLLPARVGGIIAVECTHEGGDSEIIHARTAGGGNFQVRWPVRQDGLWQVRAYFVGDDVLAPAETGVIHVSAK